MRTRLVHNFALFFICVVSANTQTWRWKTHTSMRQIRQMAVMDSTIWCVTEGGLLAFNWGKQTFQAWTNTEGLASIQLSTLTVDSKKRIYLGYRSGIIQRFDPSNSSWFLLDDYRGHAISSLYPRGDTLFVGLDIGLSMYLLSKREVKETYKHLGPLFQVELPVNKILLVGKEIWVATSKGAARSNLDYPNLLNPSAWSDYTTSSGLPQNRIVDLVSLNGEVYAATERGVAVFRNNQWFPLNKNFPNAEVMDLSVYQNQLSAATSDGIYLWNQNAWIPYGKELVSCRSQASSSTNLWVGTDQGIADYSLNTLQWVFYQPNSPASNLFSDLVVDHSGVLWCASASTRGAGFYRFDGEQWTHFNTRSNPRTTTDDVYSVAVDKSGAKWFGTWGRGLLYWNERDPFRFYNSQNGYLAGIPIDLEYSVVADVSVDSSGTVWLLNYESARNAPLVSVTRDTVWTYYGTTNGLFTNRCRHIAIDQQGRKWIGTEGQGILLYDDRGTPTDLSDDSAVSSITSADGLSTNLIKALVVSRDGTVWIGTEAGLFYYENGVVKPKYGLLSENVTQLLVDGVNNLWVGTSAGLSYFSVRDYQWVHFHTGNSGLVSNDITSLAMDYSTGMLYIGTNLGISVLETPFSEPLGKLAGLKIYPNPFHPSQHRQMTIDNLAEGVSVHILSPAGYRVRRFSDSEVFGKQIYWDGLDDRGEPVSGGVYIIVQQNENGERKLGKAALIR